MDTKNQYHQSCNQRRIYEMEAERVAVLLQNFKEIDALMACNKIHHPNINQLL